MQSSKNFKRDGMFQSIKESV